MLNHIQKPLFSLISFIIIIISNLACETIPVNVIEKRYTINRYLSPSREPNLNVHDYSCLFIANGNSKKFNIINVKCNNMDAKLFLLNTKSTIVSDFNKNDTILLRSSIIRANSNPTKDTIAILYKFKGRINTMYLTDFQKVETPINQ